MKTVLVSSVKGGTGKSLISLNLALELRDRGYRVGLIDADITSPYFKVFTKANLTVEADPAGRIRLPEWRGIKVFSMSLIGEGPTSMHGATERQILSDLKSTADWGELDYLIIDLPAGAEDVFKESIKLWGDRLAGGVAVMIPFAEKSARELIGLWGYYGVPILGIIENMCCVYCNGEPIYVFGKPKGEAIAGETGVEYLGMIPLLPEIAEGIERGEPRIPEEYREPIVRLADKVVEAKPVNIAGGLTERIRNQLRQRLAKVIAKAVIHLNKEYPIGGYIRKYGLPGGRIFTVVITDDDDVPLVYASFKIKDDKLVILRGNPKPQWVVELPYRTLVDLVRGYREYNGRRLPFNVETAWRIGELKIYGRASIPMLIYIFKHLLSDKELVEGVSRGIGGAMS